MSTRFTARLAACLIAFLVVAELTFAPIHAGNPAGSLDLQSVLRTGESHERSSEWGDAIELYEKASKEFPESTELEQGLRRSRIHYNVERRYSDRSFTRGLLAMGYEDSRKLFDQIYQMMSNEYLDPVSATAFTAHGTESVYFALNNQKFLTHHLSNDRRSEVAAVRRAIFDQFWNRPTRNLQAAHELIREMSAMCESRLGIPANAVVLEYAFGGCHSLDDYSGILTPTRYNDLRGSMQGNFVGVGIEMKSESGKGLLLTNVLKGSPAAEGGLRRQDYIVAVDGWDCRTSTIDEAASRLQGREGSRVKLDIQRGDETLTKQLTRRAVTVLSVPVAKIVDQRSGVAYLQMTSFQETTSQELDAALVQLHRQGMRSLVWDLRGNPGGLLDQAAAVLDRFIPAPGTLVSTRGRDPNAAEVFRARHFSSGKWDRLPLVLLVDGGSASASEIVAGAINDYDRGTIVGRKTYGKWSVQSVFPISVRTVDRNEKCGLRLTIARFYSPHNHSYSKVGLKPHVEVKMAESLGGELVSPGGDDISPENDPDLRKAVEVLQEKLATR